MNKRTKEVLVVSLALGATVVSLYFGFARRSPKVNLDPYNVLGAVTAEETAKLLADKGLVLVMARDTGADKNPSVEAELNAFQQTLKKHPSRVPKRLGPCANVSTRITSLLRRSKRPVCPEELRPRP